MNGFDAFVNEDVVQAPSINGSPSITPYRTGSTSALCLRLTYQWTHMLLCCSFALRLFRNSNKPTAPTSCLGSLLLGPALERRPHQNHQKHGYTKRAMERSAGSLVDGPNIDDRTNLPLRTELCNDRQQQICNAPFDYGPSLPPRGLRGGATSCLFLDLLALAPFAAASCDAATPLLGPQSMLL